jgi:hypothetical protein
MSEVTVDRVEGPARAWWMGSTRIVSSAVQRCSGGMYRGHRTRALADGSRDAFHRATSHVADREDARLRRFERKRPPRPVGPAVASVRRPQGRVRVHEAGRVSGEVGKPVGGRNGADEAEQCGGRLNGCAPR